METVELDGKRVAFERAGGGPALVILHGYVGDGVTTWRPQLKALRDEFLGTEMGPKQLENLLRVLVRYEPEIEDRARLGGEYRLQPGAGVA
jgi:hypothetical protein